MRDGWRLFSELLFPREMEECAAGYRRSDISPGAMHLTFYASFSEGLFIASIASGRYMADCN
jgi:hypothetical protein